MLKYPPNMPAVTSALPKTGSEQHRILGDASTLSAFSEAVRVLKRGQADAIITGGVGVRIHPAVWVRNGSRTVAVQRRPRRGVAPLRRLARRRGER